MGFLSQAQPYSSLGPVDLNTVEKVEVVITDREKERLERFNARPLLDNILNLHDFEVRRNAVI